MTNMERMNDLAILVNEEELIIKPYHSGRTKSTVEYGLIVSRLNRPLFDYQIGMTLFNRRILLINPMNDKSVLEVSHNRLPVLLKFYCKQQVRTLFDDIRSIGSIQQKLAFRKLWYNIYDIEREHVVSLMLRKRHLRSKIQHRIREFEIFDENTLTLIGRIYPYSMNLEQTKYGPAVAMRIPKDMTPELKATLLMAALTVKSRIQ